MTIKELPFSIVPVEVAFDDRLSKIQIRVLIALFSFRNRSTGLCCPKRESISERCGYDPATVSRATTALQKHGWLTKKGDGRFGTPLEYEIHTPIHLTDQMLEGAMVSGSGTHPKNKGVRFGQGRVSSSGTHLRVTDSVTPNKHTIKQTRQHTIEKAQTEFERWWKTYPKKVGKKAALTAWKRHKPNADTLIADTTDRIKHDRKWIEGFIKDPVRYITSEQWNDEYEQPRAVCPADRSQAIMDRISNDQSDRHSDYLENQRGLLT